MLRFIFRLVMLAVLATVVAALYFGYMWMGGSDTDRTVGTTGLPIDAESAKRAGTEIAQTVAKGASQAGKTLSEAALTTKIRSKMALDDTIDAGRINVDTAGTVVTVSGVVATTAQRDRILQLARETAGVTSVVNRVEVKAEPR
jgi:osmotically-inducible protein OsmY